MTESVKLFADALSTFSLAAQQNAYPLVKSLRLSYLPVEKSDSSTDSPRPIAGAKVQLNSIPGWLEPEEWLIDLLVPGQTLTLPKRDLKLSFEKLFGLTEEVKVNIDFDVTSNSGEKLTSISIPVSILPANYWGGESRQPDLLAAFVKPNGVYVESLIKEVADVLEQAGYGRSVDGYQSNTREKPYLMIAALWNVIFNQRLAYVTPPPGFAQQGQRIRLASDISNAKIAACLDTSLLFASCIEAMGLNAVVALTEGHAFAGAWLIDDRLPVLTNDDPIDIRKRVDSRDIVLFETTLVTNSQPVTFEQAKEHARNLISEENEEKFVFVIDISQARARQIKPMSTVEARRDEVFAKSAVLLEIPALPPLPPVRADERVQEETADTRVDTWSRKLLDLSKRNNLLNFKEKAVSIKLYCPDIATLEDMLADGNRFRFVSAEVSPINDAERDKESFRLQTGSDIHRQYALDQLNRNVLVANQTQARLEKNAIELFRKAKNDLEEGGSNTLFLALGMLKWKENPEDDRSYRAPLILIPVVLNRSSARAPISVQQLQDENPIFNLTLLEFLQSEHDINLSEFKDELPEDESGVDVPFIWTRVREKISEHRGFEVVEELVLASFSFAKYLMWKDLRDRIEDLKENAFVKHLIDDPKEPYAQEANFVERDKVDEIIDPSTMFTPLNCDSSQLVAVEASARAQDFVLEGPPGTGKSETIANIIAHNIGKGRKILFVAEKMAALNVVYRRLQRVGLDHLCLELHSNKANKRMVLDQLGRSWQRRKGLSSKDWLAYVEELKQKREHLNSYVQALHRKSPTGLSLRDAISRLALRRREAKFELGWVPDLEASPLKTEADLKATFELIDNISVAFKDVTGIGSQGISSIQSTSWSNAWQTKLLGTLSQLDSILPDLDLASTHLIKEVKLDERVISLEDLDRLSALGELIELAIIKPVDFALAKGAKERIDLINLLADKKKELDQIVVRIGYNVTNDNIGSLPIDDWLRRCNESKGRWIKTFLAKRKINATGKRLGLSKFEDLSAIYRLEEARELQREIKNLVRQVGEFAIWQGWQTTPKQLYEASYLGSAARSALAKAMGLAKDPTALLISLKKYLIDGRDYLEGSRLVGAWNEFKRNLRVFSGCDSILKELGFVIEGRLSLRELGKATRDTIANKAKLKNWCEWQAAKELAKGKSLSNLVRAIEAGSISPDSAKDQFLIAYCEWLAPQLIDNDPLLKEFKSSTHELNIAKFRELDKKVTELTSEYVVALASEKVPKSGVTTGNGEYGVLARELQKKTRHIPVRTLIDRMGSFLLDLCPCLMMSPLSVAQFLPSNFRNFDIVVFDEASQMTTWDSVGAIARGKNVVVVGDPKQMPPTNFFSSVASNDDPDEEDLESILDQALAARLPLKRLMGHYRSKHETLIAFSNSKYYENSLVTYPSSDTKETAVSLRRVNGAYAKGKGRNNPIEAKAVVDEVVRRLTDNQHATETIGIVALNTDQQRTILDLLDDARRQNQSIERFFQDRDGYDSVFVKNLESVQGDERDVIILSLGYGPTEIGGKTMSMNFGPLNKLGGERRLNVAITRATSEVLVFASFDSSMIDLSRTSSTAIEHLKHYLEFAERGPSSLAEQATAAYGIDQFDSDFEQAVAFALREKGWKVQTQVGVSKFRVDLGIIHPECPGAYLAGIECDGATYHSSPSARDRDRVRHVVLENLGWRLIRLWSTDYFIDHETAIDKIDLQLQALLDKDRAQALEAAEELKKEDSLEVQFQPADLHQNIDEDITEFSSQTAQFKSADYFKPEHSKQLIDSAKEILREKPGITLHTLALDIANLHGLSRTSKKQLSHLKELITPWAGISEVEGYSPTVWFSSTDVVEEIPWRGVDAFGDSRTWGEISFHEALGLGRYALEKAPNEPVDFICKEFDLKRRHEQTLGVFKGWIERARSRI